MTSPTAQSSRPTVIVFDVNETLSDLSPLGARFAELGASASATPLWFASVLRDAFALTAAGAQPRFAEVARAQLRSQLGEAALNRDLDAAVEHVMEGFARLGVHPDVVHGVDRLHEDGFRLVTFSNGSASVAEQLLESAGVRDRFEALLSVDDAGAWKPTERSYRYAVDTCGVAPAEAALVAVHPWDVDGALRAGLQGVWVNRSGASYPSIFTPPTHTVTSLEELAELW